MHESQLRPGIHIYWVIVLGEIVINIIWKIENINRNIDSVYVS